MDKFDKIDRDCLHHTRSKYLVLGTEKHLQPADFFRAVMGWDDEEIAKMLRWMKGPAY